MAVGWEIPSLPLRWATDDAPSPEGRVDDQPSAEVEVEIQTSKRRRKTATAFWQHNRIVVVVPAHLRGRERAEMVDWLVERVRAKRPGTGSSDEELYARAVELADRYVNGERPQTIRWVTNQSRRWGSCSATTRDIRISHRLKSVPNWVLDAILVHELAHLVHPDHGPRFRQLADRYPRQREAALFLDGYELGLEQLG
jgi:predicted metal-dependent hydrolase